MEQQTTAASLPDDLLLEILVRVKDVPTLFRCATACKRWRHLVADPSFLRCRWPDQDYSSSLVGFFTWHCQQGLGYRDRHAVFKPFFVPTGRSPLGPGLRTLSSFVTAAPAGLFDRAVPLVSRHGRLLVRLEACYTDGVRPDLNILQLAVCNLLVGTCHMLPPLKFAWGINDKDDYDFSAYAVLTGADCGSNDESSSPSHSSFFKVVIITSDYDDLKHSLHIFSSDNASWTTRTNCFDDTSERLKCGVFGDVVVRRGTAYWLFHYGEDPCFYLISLNTRTSHISKTKLHFLTDYFLTRCVFLTLVAHGKPEIWMQTGSQLKIWGQQDGRQNVGGTYLELLCTRTIAQNELGDDTQGRQLHVFGEKCGTLLVKDDHQHMYTADLETGGMDEVSNWPCEWYISRWDVVPIEMDWPSIFISQLSVTF